MANKSKQLAVFLLAIILSGLVFVDTLQLSTAQTGTQVDGIISKDIIWTKANSPYNLKGPVDVTAEATLTIELGTVVNLGSYYLQIDGTLISKGINANPIIFLAGKITFTSSSQSWNEQTSIGSIIKDSFFNTTSLIIQSASPKITSNTFVGSTINLDNSESSVLNNTLTQGSIVSGGFEGLPIITNNTIREAEYGIQLNGGNASISHNHISGCNWGISLSTVEVFGGSFSSFPKVEKNLITENNNGIGIFLNSRFQPGEIPPIISNNTISKNKIGLFLRESNFVSPTLIFNNVYDNIDYNIFLDSSTQNIINATYNWWGTTDIQAINQSMYDFKNDFNLGTVNFVPFLTGPNPQAMPNPNAPTITPSPTISPTPTQTPTTITNQTIIPSSSLTISPTTTIPEFATWIFLSILPILALTALTALVYAKRIKREKDKILIKNR